MALTDKLTAIGDAIREKTETTELIPLAEMPNKVNEVFDIGSSAGYAEGHLTGYAEGQQEGWNNGYEVGRKEEYDRFWESYQQNGNRKNYKNAFMGYGWTAENFKPKYDIVPTNAQLLFDTSQLTDLVDLLERQDVALDLSKATSVGGAFQVAAITRLPVIDVSSATNTENIFYSNSALKTVEKFIVSETTNLTNTGNAFAGANNLEKIIFEGVIWQSFKIHWCTKLTHESLMSILNCLKDYSGSNTTYTVTLGTTNLAKLTDAEKAIATQKGWTLA